MSRSSIIQQLSLLVTLLGLVEPSAPNKQLCVDCKAVIRRVLDHHLNSSVSMTNTVPDFMDWGLEAMPNFNFQLLDTFEWFRSGSQQ